MGSVNSQYLQRYAEREIQLASKISECWSSAVSIPICGEEPQHLTRLVQSLIRTQKTGPTLIVLVLNGRDDHEAQTHVLNAAALELSWVKDLKALDSAAKLGAVSEGCDVLLIDRASTQHRLPVGEGVGLARKIGMDLTLALVENEQISDPFVRTTDADAEVAPDYLEDLSPYRNKFSACLYPFEHRSDRSYPTHERQAVHLYDEFLRYYREGLEWAGSPYAFFTIGSTLAIEASAYAAVRGFPKRQAGEDFYILNKLAKIRPIQMLSLEPLVLHHRPSERVPFGTGKSVIQISALLEQGLDYEVYDPKIFDELKTWLQIAQAYCTADSPVDLTVELSALNKATRSVLKSLNAVTNLEKAYTTRPNATQRLAHFHTWFDAFRTLKFIHNLRDQCWPNLPFAEARQRLSLCKTPTHTLIPRPSSPATI